MAGRFSVEAVFKAVDRVTAPVTRMQNRVGKLTRSMSRGFNKLNRSVGKFASSVKRGALAATAALVLSGAAMANVITTGAEFEQTLVNAAAKFPGEIRRGTKAFEQLEAAAKKTGSTTEFTASQAAKALNFLAMAGFNAESSVAALPGVVDLATVAQIDLATATDIASDTLGAFSLATKDPIQLAKNLARVNDVLAKTSTTANTTIEAMFEAIKDGGPIAVTAGASIETFAALTGTLANAGIKGSKAGTTLKNMFVKLAAPVARGAKLLRRLGITTKDSNGDMRDIVDILDDLNGSLDGLGTADRSGILEGIFGKIPLAGVNVLLAAGSEELRKYRKRIIAASGANSEMASVMRDTLQGRLNALKSAVEGVKISIFSMTSGPLVDAIEKTTEWVRANEALIATNVGEFIAKIITNLPAIIEWVAWGAKAVVAFIAFVTVLKTLVGVLTIVNLLMVANPITLVVLAVIAAIAAFTTLVIWIDEVASAFGRMNPFVRALLAPLELVIRTIKFIKDAFKGGFGGAISKLAVSLGFDTDTSNTPSGNTGPQVISPQERVARSIEEQRTTSTAEVTIRDESGRAEVTAGSLGSGLNLQPSGAF